MLDVVLDALRALAERGEVPRDLLQRELSAATTIDELAIDSLGKLALISELEDRLELAIGEGLLAGVRSLGDLAQLASRLKKVAA
jgi:acyl carrier protein